SRLVPKIARDLETICLKCLNKEPAKRYSTALALVEDLDRFRNGETILARRALPLERGIKWARRRPAAAALLGLAVTVFLGLTLGGAFYERNRRLREGERSQRDLRLMSDMSRLIDRSREVRSAKELSQLQVEMSGLIGGLNNEDESRLDGLH